MIESYSGQPRYSELVERVFNEPDILPPGLLLELEPFEWWMHKRKRAWASYRLVVNNPGFPSRTQLVNQSNDVIVVVTDCRVKTPTASPIMFTIEAPAGAPTYQAVFRDSRIPGFSRAGPFSTNNVALP